MPHLIVKLTPWIRRDLCAIFPSTNTELIKDYILALLQTHNLQSDEFVEGLGEYLGDDTELFVHELVGFARSPLEMKTYDSLVQYANMYN